MTDETIRIAAVTNMCLAAMRPKHMNGRTRRKVAVLYPALTTSQRCPSGFAAMGDSVETVLLESVVMIGFAIAAVAGFKSSAWIVVGALAGHGVFDVLHGEVLENAGVPVWWPAFCLAFDLGAAASLAWLLKRGLTTNDTRD